MMHSKMACTSSEALCTATEAVVGVGVVTGAGATVVVVTGGAGAVVVVGGSMSRGDVTDVEWSTTAGVGLVVGTARRVDAAVGAIHRPTEAAKMVAKVTRIKMFMGDSFLTLR
jgi:hypothetical protein